MRSHGMLTCTGVLDAVAQEVLDAVAQGVIRHA